jgi:hypothetical protein
MKTNRGSRDDRENRAERQEKLGAACDTLPAKTLADQIGASKPVARAKASLESAHKGKEQGVRHLKEAAGSSPPSALKGGGAVAPAESVVTFCLAAPNAAEVMIAGSFSNWSSQRMSRGAPGSNPGEWRIDLPLKAGKYEYRFVVDGAWIDDPKATDFVPNGLGDRNAVLEVRVDMPRA